MKSITFKELRIKSKLTQEQVAEKSGFSKDYISMIERGERNPSDKAKAIFANVFNVPIVQIFLSLQRTNSTTRRVENENKDWRNRDKTLKELKEN